MDKMQTNMSVDPEIQKIIQEKLAELQKKLDSGDFGTSDITVKFDPDSIKITLNTTKPTIDLMNSVHDMILEIQKLEEAKMNQPVTEQPVTGEPGAIEPGTEEPQAETPEAGT
jgi:ribosome-associated translation inhibitor RaiA